MIPVPHCIPAGAWSRLQFCGMGCESFRRCPAAGDGPGVLQSGGSSGGFGGRRPSISPPCWCGGFGYVLLPHRRVSGSRLHSPGSQGVLTSRPLPSTLPLGRTRRPPSWRTPARLSRRPSCIRFCSSPSRPLPATGRLLPHPSRSTIHSVPPPGSIVIARSASSACNLLI